MRGVLRRVDGGVKLHAIPHRDHRLRLCVVGAEGERGRLEEHEGGKGGGHPPILHQKSGSEAVERVGICFRVPIGRVFRFSQPESQPLAEFLDRKKLPSWAVESELVEHVALFGGEGSPLVAFHSRKVFASSSALDQKTEAM